MPLRLSFIVSIIIVIITLIHQTTNASDVYLLSYSAETIQQYIFTAANGNVSDKCRDSLLKVEPFLSAYDTLPLQKRLFYASYAAGDATHVQSRDRDRWHFRFRGCIIAAAEDTIIPSEHPMMFCTGHDNTNKTAFELGVCLPTPCFNDHLYLLNEWKRIVDNGDNGRINVAHCTKSRHDKQWFELYGTIAELTSGFAIVAIVSFATVYHLLRGDETKSTAMQIFLAFSAKKNLNAIITPPKNPTTAIKCIWGIRVITTLWVVLGHAGVFIADFIEEADELKRNVLNHFFYQPLTNAPISVDIFFVIGAVLCSYHWFRSIDKPGALIPTWYSWKYWFGFYRHRLLRLWPAYLYVILLSIIRFPVLRYHENFPLWGPDDFGVECSKHWWENALFINTFTDGRCLPWTWYMGTEFTFFAMSPIFLLLLKRSAPLGIALSVIIIIASSVLLTVETLRYNFPPTQLLHFIPQNFNQDSMLYQSLIYVRPQYRIGPYLVGLITGYILATGERPERKNNSESSSKRFMFVGWILSVIGGLWSIYGLIPALQRWDWPIYQIIFTSMHRITWALSISWLIYACQKGFGGLLNAFLSMRLFLPLSAACYALYLGHIFAIFAIYMSSSFPIHYEGFNTLLNYYWKHLFLCYFIAISILLCVEMPALHIVKILFYKSEQQMQAEAKRQEIITTQDEHGIHSSSIRYSNIISNNNLIRRIRPKSRRA
uniref:Nose resistant to fluoxetine protein 6 n=1 Tax=Ascaris suum TaxID=6253 RepID=F1KXK3_ASCSU